MRIDSLFQDSVLHVLLVAARHVHHIDGQYCVRIAENTGMNALCAENKSFIFKTSNGIDIHRTRAGDVWKCDIKVNLEFFAARWIDAKVIRSLGRHEPAELGEK